MWIPKFIYINPKSEIIRKDNTINILHSDKDITFVYSTDRLKQTEMKQITDKELKRQAQTLYQNVLEEISLDYKSVFKDIIDFKHQFYHHIKVFDEKLRNIKQSINADNDLFIGNFEKITYLMEQEFIERLHSENLRVNELENIKGELQSNIKSKSDLIMKEYHEKLERNKSTYTLIESELKDLMDSIFKEYDKKLECLYILQITNREVIDSQLAAVKNAYEEKLYLRQKEKTTDKNEKLNIQYNINNYEKQKNNYIDKLGFREVYLAQVEREIKSIEDKIVKGTKEEEAIEVNREFLVKQIEHIKTELEKLSKQELDDHNLIKLKNERMYYLEYSNNELNDKLKELTQYKEKIHSKLYEEKLLTNEYSHQFDACDSRLYKLKRDLELYMSRNTFIRIIVDNALFTISQMYRDNNFVDKMNSLKMLIVKMNKYFEDFRSFSQFKAKYTENKQVQMEMFETQLDSRVDLQYFHMIKDILQKETEFSNNKISTFNMLVDKVKTNMAQNSEKFKNDENYLLDFYHSVVKDRRYLMNETEIIKNDYHKVQGKLDQVHEKQVYKKDSNAPKFGKLGDIKQHEGDAKYNKIMNWKPQKELPYLERRRNAHDNAIKRKQEYYDTYEAYETMDKINEMGAKLSNLDSKMIDFFKSYTKDNFEQNELKREQKVETIDMTLKDKQINFANTPVDELREDDDDKPENLKVRFTKSTIENYQHETSENIENIENQEKKVE